MEYNVKATLKRLKNPKGNPVPKKNTVKKKFNASAFLHSCELKRKTIKKKNKSLKD